MEQNYSKLLQTTPNYSTVDIREVLHTGSDVDDVHAVLQTTPPYSTLLHTAPHYSTLLDYSTLLLNYSPGDIQVVLGSRRGGKESRKFKPKPKKNPKP